MTERWSGSCRNKIYGDKAAHDDNHILLIGFAELIQ